MKPMPRPVATLVDGEFHPALPPGDPWVDQATSGLDLVRVMRRLGQNPIGVLGASLLTKPHTVFDLGRRKFMYVQSPDLIREAFVEKREHLTFNPIRQSILKPIIRDGLIAAEGEPWRRARHAATPIFTPRAVGRFADCMRETAQDFVERQPDSQDVSLDAWASELTYGVLKSALFSDTLSADADSVTEALARVLSQMGRPDLADLFRLPGWVPRLSKLGGQKDVEAFRSLVRETINKRKEDVPVDDLLGLLLSARAEDGSALSSEELEDNVVSFVGAGHETTARWLVWWLYLLSQDATVRERVETEADALDVGSDPADWKDRLPFLFATLEEALRLYPSAPMLSRSIAKDVTIGGVELPVGSDLVVNIMAVHRHRDLWDTPDAFRPERFLGQARERIGRFQYLPFGVGHRVCIGQRFAVQEAVILGALVLRGLRFDYMGEADPWPVMRVTISADNGMPMRVTRRR